MQPLEINAPDLSLLDETTLRRMAAAGEVMIRAEKQLSKAGHNIVQRVVGDLGPKHELVPLQHYPPIDVFDYETGSQYYFHTHEDRDGEYGHFHLFMREQGLPMEAQPVRIAPNDDMPIAHVVALSMDRQGRPLSLFTTNGWVTTEDFFRAEDIISGLPRFGVDHTNPCLAVNQWLTAAMTLFAPQIQALLVEREAILEPLAHETSWESVLENRSLDVITRTPISLEGQMRQILTTLATIERS